MGTLSYYLPSGYDYYVSFIDVYSKFTWIYPLKSKSKTLFVFQQFKTMVELQLNHKIKNVQFDWGENTNLSLLFCLIMASLIDWFAPTHTIKMVWLKESIDTLLNLVLHSFISLFLLFLSLFCCSCNMWVIFFSSSSQSLTKWIKYYRD